MVIIYSENRMMVISFPSCDRSSALKRHNYVEKMNDGYFIPYHSLEYIRIISIVK